MRGEAKAARHQRAARTRHWGQASSIERARWPCECEVAFSEREQRHGSTETE